MNHLHILKIVMPPNVTAIHLLWILNKYRTPTTQIESLEEKLAP